MNNDEEVQPRTSLVNRMIGAARLDEDLYGEVAVDGSAIIQAFVVVGLAAMATRLSTGDIGFWSLIVAIPRLTGWWLAMTLIIYLLTSTILRSSNGRPSWLILARTMGFAQSPLVLRGILILPFIPSALWSLLFVGTLAWQFAAIIVAVRLVIKSETTKAAVTVGIAFLPIQVIEPFLLR